MVITATMIGTIITGMAVTIDKPARASTRSRDGQASGNVHSLTLAAPFASDYFIPRSRWTHVTASDPSPTANPTRFVDPARMSLPASKPPAVRDVHCGSVPGISFGAADVNFPSRHHIAVLEGASESRRRLTSDSRQESTRADRMPQLR